MIKCPKCGNANEDTNMHCAFCGYQFPGNNQAKTRQQANFDRSQSQYQQQTINKDPNQYQQQSYNKGSAQYQQTNYPEPKKQGGTGILSNLSSVGKIGLIIAICCIGIIVMGLFGGGANDQGSLANSNFTFDDILENTTTVNNNINSNAEIFEDGTYKVGTDIDAGEYLFTQTSEYGGYIQRASDSTMESDSIISNGFTSNKGETLYITVKNGEYIKVQGGKLVDSASTSGNSATSNGQYIDGMYKVGSDIPAGEYKYTQTSNYTGYIERASDSSLEPTSIISNELTSAKGETAYVSIKNGEYLTIMGGYIVKA